MKKYSLTILITIHSQFNSVMFFHELINRNKFNKEKILFAFDCEEKEIPQDIRDFLVYNNYNYFCPNKNVGKLKLVIESSKLIKSNFFKIIDQDDSIYFNNLNLVEFKLSKLKGTELVKHKALKIKKNSKHFIQTLDEKIIKKQVSKGFDPHFIQGTNCNIIYPTQIIRMMDGIDFTRQDFHNDILLSNFVVGMGSPKVSFNDKFYIQFHQRGQTSKITTNRSDSIPELYENYKLIKNIYINFNFKRVMYGSIFLHKIYIKNFTLWYLKGKNKKHGKENYLNSIKLLRELSREVEDE